jgi:hypothetical protein
MKNSLDRRNILKGLLALPASAAFGGWMTAPETADDATIMADLRIVVHGAMALHFVTAEKKEEQFLEILIPEVKSHEYEAGLLLQEDDFAASSPFMPMPGAIVGSNTLPDVLKRDAPSSTVEQFVILRKRDLQSQSGAARNTMRLPYPKSLDILRASGFINPGHQFFSQSQFIPIKPIQVPDTVALQYEVQVSKSFPLKRIHYHIFADPSTLEVSTSHVLEAFNALNQLFNGVGRLQLSPEALQPCLLKSIVTADPPQFNKIEAETLAERRSAILRLQRAEHLASPESHDSKFGVTGSAHLSCMQMMCVSGKDA